ncbi:hypothetical protein [Nocardia sp. CA-119907]|uniref:hypothetical protein n=1 Tax=Nocardia sp. CA-119907 TaxID=3239973 RepID=UPI003D9968A3
MNQIGDLGDFRALDPFFRIIEEGVVGHVRQLCPRRRIRTAAGRTLRASAEEFLNTIRSANTRRLQHRRQDR